MLVQFWQIEVKLKPDSIAMKKLVATLLPLMLAIAAFAQRNAVEDIDRENFFRIGAKGSFNLNKIPHTSFNDGFRYNYQIGGFMQFNFSKRFGVQPEVNFVQSTTTQSKDVSEVWDDLFRDGAQKMKSFNYLEIPVLMNMNVGDSRHVKLQAGPAISFLVNHKDAKEGTYQMYKNGELSMMGGLWIQLPFINIGGRYKWGLANVYHVADKASAHNQALEFFIGFTF